jgi:DNA invertase Pin-like site-specific DNA recombinase
MMKQRARIYARVSGDRQKKDNTVANQLSASVERDIARMGLEPTGHYTDDGKSASAGKLHLRGDFNRMLADAARKEFDVLWVADLDRITRSNDWGELGQIFGPLQKAGIKLAGPNLPPMELGNTMSMMQIMMKIIVAYEDNQKRVERFMIGKREAAKRGCHVQGPVPYGLTWRTGARDSSGWGIDKDKAALVAEAYRRVLAGESGHMVARDFELRGEKPPRGGRWFEPVSRFLRSPIYRGETSYYGVPVKIPAIVDEDTWFRVQAILGTSKKRGLRQTRHQYLCESLGVCSACGSPMRIRGGGQEDDRFTYYVCRDRTDIRKDMSKRCELPRFRTDTIDEAVWGTVAAFFEQPQKRILRTLLGHVKTVNDEVGIWAADAKRYEGQLEALQAAEEVFMEELERGMLTKEAFRERLAKNTVRRRNIQGQLKDAYAAMEAMGASASAGLHLEAILDEVQELARSANFEERRTLVKWLVRRGDLTFDAHGVNVRLVFGDDVKAPNRDLAIGAGSEAGVPAVTLRVVAQ